MSLICDSDGVVGVFVRSPYNYDRDWASFETGLSCTDASRTAQEFAQEADINVLAERYGLLGEFPRGLVMPVYGDFEGIGDYHGAANAIASANETFDQLPAAIRSRFGNDPGAFVDFALDVNNRDEMRKWGMLDEKAVASPAGDVLAASVPASET